MQDKIITYLKNNKNGTAKEISQTTGIQFTTMSKHLKRLANFNILEWEWKDNERIWRLNNRGGDGGEKEKSL